MEGRVHSFQSLGTLDGPGVRFVVFMQGCNLRCSCCHNPDTWELAEGTLYSPADVASRVERYREYFGTEGGVTVSGGEPLLQADFVRELFVLCHKARINTCLDTSGSIINDKVVDLLEVTDRVLLDIKYTEDSLYRSYVGCNMETPVKFLDILDEMNIPVTLRQVVIPGINDNTENILKLKEIAGCRSCVDKIELLPFRKICQVKYDKLGLEFPFAHIPEPSAGIMAELNSVLTHP